MSAPSPLANSDPARGFTQDFSFEELRAAIRARAWLITLLVCLGLVAAAAYCWQAPKIYRSTVRVQVEQRGAKVVKIQQVQQEDLQSDAMLNTVIQSMTARPLLRRVVAANDLAHRADFLPDHQGEPPSEEALVGALGQMVTIALVKETRLIDVSVDHQKPRLAQKLATSVVDEYLRQTLETRSKTSEMAHEFLLKQVQETKERLEKAERALQGYAEKSQSVSLEDRSNITLEKLKELNSKLTEVRSQRARLEADGAYLRQVGHDPEKVLVVPSVASMPVIADLKKSLAAQEVEISILSERYRAKHPEMLAARNKLEQLQGKLRDAARRAPEQLATAFAGAQETERTFQTELDQLEKLTLEMKGKSIQYNVLNRDVETDRVLYTSLLARLKETEVASELSSAEFRVIEPAEAASPPIKPAKLKILILTFVACLTLGVALAITWHALDSSIKTLDQAERALGLQVLAAVPFDKRYQRRGAAPVAVAPAYDLVTEAFRTLRTSLLLRGAEGEARACAFTSSVASEGKSFCSANYAVALAQQGFSTLLIDADLRRPMLHRLFNAPAHAAGVTEILLGASTFEEAAIESAIANLSILPAGAVPANPAELLGGTGFAEIMSQALERYERVVIDTAPVNLVSDTLLIAAAFHHLCLVLQAGQTPVKVARHALAQLAKTEVVVAGLVLNQVPARNSGYYYSYGSDKVYGAENQRPPAKQASRV